MSFSPAPPPGTGAKRRTFTFIVVILCHVLALMGPVWIAGVTAKRKTEENMFRVKIGGTKLSQGPMVGMPERTPPPKKQREPQIPIPPAEPQIPVVAPRKIAEPAIPRVSPRPRPEVTPKPKVRRPPVKKVPKRSRIAPRKQREPIVPTVKPKPKVQRKFQKKIVKRQVKNNPLDGVFRPPNSPNLNPAVPVGNRNRAQKYAPKADNRTPGGGRKADEETFRRYGRNVERYIYSRWSEPPRTLLRGNFPETVIEITIEADGRVSEAKIVKPSNSIAMEESVKALISSLDLLPRPPEGRITFRITLKTR
ncbi:MAG: TonB family protein [Lentisphaeria bacterium]|nr:TonB family protein [Lentisphaeria bacterium]